MTPKQQKGFLNKLRQPIHISYISKYMLKCNESEAKTILEPYIKTGIIKESELSKGYFVLVNESSK